MTDPKLGSQPMTQKTNVRTGAQREWRRSSGWGFFVTTCRSALALTREARRWARPGEEELFERKPGIRLGPARWRVSIWPRRTKAMVRLEAEVGVNS